MTIYANYDSHPLQDDLHSRGTQRKAVIRQQGEKGKEDAWWFEKSLILWNDMQLKVAHPGKTLLKMQNGNETLNVVNEWRAWQNRGELKVCYTTILDLNQFESKVFFSLFITDGRLLRLRSWMARGCLWPRFVVSHQWRNDRKFSLGKYAMFLESKFYGVYILSLWCTTIKKANEVTIVSDYFGMLVKTVPSSFNTGPNFLPSICIDMHLHDYFEPCGGVVSIQ